MALCYLPICAPTLNDLENAWARQLLGAPPWSNAAILRAELGWVMSVAAKCVLDIARRRARLWRRPVNGGSTWAAVSLRVLNDWDIVDYAAYAHDTTYTGYITYVKEKLWWKCWHNLSIACRRRVQPFHYHPLLDSEHALLRHMLSTAFERACLHDVMSFVLMRAGLVVVSHRNRSRSRARMQFCISCGAVVNDPYVHVLLCCDVFSDVRLALFDVFGTPGRMNREGLYGILKLQAAQVGFVEAVALTAAVDRAADTFWRGGTAAAKCKP